MMNRENKYTTQQLREFQALPLERKVGITCARLTEFYTHFDGKVFVSFSGGKDSTVLLHIARKLFPDIKALYLDTGLEYPEIKEFVKSFDNVDIRRPEMSFKKVIETVGYPVISKEISQYIMEYRNYLEKLATGKGKKRKSPITEFEQLRREEALHDAVMRGTGQVGGYFKDLEDALGGLPPPEAEHENRNKLLPDTPPRKNRVARSTTSSDTTCASVGRSLSTPRSRYHRSVATS